MGVLLTALTVLLPVIVIALIILDSSGRHARRRDRNLDDYYPDGAH